MVGYTIDNYRWHLPTEADRTWIDACLTDPEDFPFSTQDILDQATEWSEWHDAGGGAHSGVWAPCILTKIETDTPVVIITGLYETTVSYSIRGMIVHPDYRDTGELLASSSEMGKWLLYRSGWGIANINIHLADAKDAKTLNDKWRKAPASANLGAGAVWTRGK